MNVGERVNRYRAIESRRERPLIVYATSTRAGVTAMMAGDAVREFIEQMDAIPREALAVDVLLHSTGGDPLTAWKLMSVLRERFKTVGVLVPYMAFSAATIFALGADEIVMHPHASLGPIDPQIKIKLPDGKQRGFSFEDVGAFLRFLRAEVGITEQAFAAGVVDRLFAAVDPVNIGAAKRASELSTDVGERLLQMHMTQPDEKPAARAIAEGLNKTFFAHGDAVSRSRARALKLKVAADDTSLEALLWEAFVGIEAYMDLRQKFDPLEHYIAGGGSTTFAPKAPLLLPSNTPPQVMNQAWSHVVQQAIQDASAPGAEVEYRLVHALLESARHASEYISRGMISVSRNGAGETQVTMTGRESSWRSVPLNPASASSAPETPSTAVAEAHL